MKKIILPLLAIVFLFSCKKESKKNVCHNGHSININVSAIPAHQAHGDAVDMDGDGYFDIENTCTEVDCDDVNADINPRATEICNNGIDNDCDGAVDYADSDCGLPSVTLPDGTVLFIHPTDNSAEIPWGGFGTDIPGLTNFRDFTDAILDFNGAANTQLIVDELGSDIYAAKLCSDLVAFGFDDWYLPSKGEGQSMTFPSDNQNYWTSTEQSAGNAYVHGPGGGINRGTNRRCLCVRR